jgi:hypothetical protein
MGSGFIFPILVSEMAQPPQFSIMATVAIAIAIGIAIERVSWPSFLDSESGTDSDSDP